eukprot:Lithocolla_globosa_v1_NODE_13193_length_383_cov_2.935976.p3 type:complete len:112 gc:universal NODE_13193_length_383_cov_2.935976:371-36(-)
MVDFLTKFTRATIWVQPVVILGTIFRKMAFFIANKTQGEFKGFIPRSTGRSCVFVLSTMVTDGILQIVLGTIFGQVTCLTTTKTCRVVILGFDATEPSRFSSFALRIKRKR